MIYQIVLFFIHLISYYVFRLEEWTKVLPQATDHTTESIDSALSGFSARCIYDWIKMFFYLIRNIYSFLGGGTGLSEEFLVL